MTNSLSRKNPTGSHEQYVKQLNNVSGSPTHSHLRLPSWPVGVLRDGKKLTLKVVPQ